MNMKNCKYLTQKLTRTLYCKKLKKTITFKNCQNCKFKQIKIDNYKKNTKIKAKTSKLATQERNRYSILTNDLKHCTICGKPRDHLHEVFFGASRQRSMKYGLVIPLCAECHAEMHKNKEWQDYWHKKGQQSFITNYPNLDFLEIFKRNYL